MGDRRVSDERVLYRAVRGKKTLLDTVQVQVRAGRHAEPHMMTEEGKPGRQVDMTGRMSC